MSSIQVMPFASSLHAAFWPLISHKKLNDLRLDESAVPVLGKYANNNREGVPATVSLEWDAFNPKLALHNATFLARGSVVNTNTIEKFKSLDKREFLAHESERIWQMMISGDALRDPATLSSFTMLMHADLKKYIYYFWFAFPSFELPRELVQSVPPQAISEELSDETCDNLLSAFQTWKEANPDIAGFFFVQIQDGSKVTLVSLEEGVKPDVKFDYVGLADPSSMQDHPGVPLRNLLTLLMVQCPDKLQAFKVICLRQTVQDHVAIGRSVVLSMTYSAGKLTDQPRSFGWEKDESGRLLPRTVNMKASMDPASLAESALDLNLKLMKWRLVPNLDLDKLKSTKCLLLGSGTLGCNVARCLLGWGVRNITFVDCGKVSYSNPSRQSLFTFEDCKNQRHKAEAAAAMMRQIFPGINSASYNLRVPMPGHTISAALEPSVKRDFETLDELIQSHDVIYLLMDTRESRWLPTVMSATYGKVVMNAALGMDSFLVMRHGIRTEESFVDPEDKAKTFLGGVGAKKTSTHYVPGHDLGCYFCNDIVAPGNSTADRTLDQQCTVTRPGVSYQAAALAVELMSSLLQHPLGPEAPAAVQTRDHDGFGNEHEGTLGAVPHTIRGSLHTFHQFLPTSLLFPKCTACSHNVLEAFKTEKFEFLQKVAGDKKYLEDLVGLTAMLNIEELEKDVFTLDDDEFE